MTTDTTNPRCGRNVLLSLLVGFVMGAAFTDDWISLFLVGDSEGLSANHHNKIVNQTDALSEAHAKMTASDVLDDPTSCDRYSNSSKPAGGRVVLEDRVRTLHIGKAGGGTMVSQVRNIWNVWFSICHPYPCVNETYSLLGRSNRTAAMILIRDPVDRFLSAFYWRQLILCDPDGDSREAVTGDRSGLAQQTDNYCRPVSKEAEETKILFGDRYNRDAEELARALCSDNSTVAEQASSDMKRIGHSMFSISDWVGTEWTNYAESIYPIVVENDFDFIEQVDNAVGWVYDTSPFEEKERFLERQASVRHQRACESAKAAAKPSDHSSGSIKTRLSEYGSKCIAQYYAADYDILGQLRDSACKSDICRSAIKSILYRM